MSFAPPGAGGKKKNAASFPHGFAAVVRTDPDSSAGYAWYKNDIVKKNIKKERLDPMNRLLWEEDGLGTVEIVLILAVLVGIALIFRQYIFDFIRDIMANIMGDSITDLIRNPLGQ